MITLDLSPQTEHYIQQIAQAQNTTPEKIASRLIENNLPERIERPFDYDLDEIKHAMESGFTEIPKSAMQDFESFDNWLQGRFA